MSKVTGEQVRASLKQCMDPEIPISIVDLGLIYGIDISEKNDVNICLLYTSPSPRDVEESRMPSSA